MQQGCGGFPLLGSSPRLRTHESRVQHGDNIYPEVKKLGTFISTELLLSVLDLHL